MEQTLSYAVRGEGRDRSRYSYEISASVWTPDKKDLAIDDALSQYTEMFGQLQIGSGSRRSRDRTYEQPPPRLYDLPQSYGYDEDDRATRRSRDGRIQEPRYAGSYAGSAVSRRREGVKAIEYYPPNSQLDDTYSSTSSRRSRRSRHTSGQAILPITQPEDIKPKHRSRRRDAGDDMSIFPEDSASCVSSRRAPSEVYTDVSRGRARRREGSVMPMKAGRGYGGQKPSMIVEEDEYDFERSRIGGVGGGGGGYATREIVPWGMA